MASTQVQLSAGYQELEEKVLARDQVGASQTFYGLLKDGHSPQELVAEIVRIHAPYTHVPYHQRFDDGLVRFVNNDHCLLSAGTGMRLMKLLPQRLSNLPLAQTMWYVPTGLDPWNQLLGKAPGHYMRLYDVKIETVTAPEIHWPDQEPEYLDGSYSERLNHWLTLVQRSEVLPAYRVFLGLLEDEANRPQLLAQLAFAGLINVQDRMLNNRSYTTGHKSFRARATIELGNLVGWENAHSVVYAGVPDMGVGPHWHSMYEMASNICFAAFEGNDHDFLANEDGFNATEVEAMFDVIINGVEPAWSDHLTALLREGKSPRRILEVIQLVASENILRTHDPKGFSMPQHAYEYCNTMRWFYDNFDHPHKVKLLYIAAGFVNRAAHHQANTPGNGEKRIDPPTGASSLSQAELLSGIERSILSLEADESVGLTAAYLQSSYDRAPLVEVMAVAASKIGNDPHNQELGMCLIEDYLLSKAEGRDRLLLAAAKHTSNHRKYGNPLESYGRFAEAFDLN